MNRSVNLMPASCLVWLERRRQFYCWIRLWIACTLVLTVASIVLLNRDQGMRGQLTSAKNKVLDVRSAFNELQNISTELKALKQSVYANRALEQPDLPLKLLQAVSQACQHSPESIQLKSLKFLEVQGARSSHPPQSETSKRQPDTYQQIILTGLASVESCGLLVSMLKESSVFSDVELVSSQAIVEQAGGRVSFQIRCDH